MTTSMQSCVSNARVPSLEAFTAKNRAQKEVSGAKSGVDAEVLTAFTEAIDLHVDDDLYDGSIDVKNERLEELLPSDFDFLAKKYLCLQSLNLSMNKIERLDCVIACPSLTSLVLADNLLTHFHPNTFSRLPKLKVLDLSINKLTAMPNLGSLSCLEELMLRQNSIGTIENLSQLSNLRVLNLSFNRITKIEGLQNLKKLEVLELGKNYISDADALQSPSNPLAYLRELYLYMNEIRTLPSKLSFPLLKILNLNRNTDLSRLDLYYCPFLEQLSASYCSITQVSCLLGCVNLQTVDLSFNQLPSLESFLAAHWPCGRLTVLTVNDNVFNFNIQEEENRDLRRHVRRVFPKLDKFNGEVCEEALGTEIEIYGSNRSRKISGMTAAAMKLQQEWRLRIEISRQYKNFLSRMLSSKIRVSYASTTIMMQHLGEVNLI